MKIALDEAEQSFKRGDFPIGAVLVIDGKMVDKCKNNSLSSNKWISHAKTILLSKNSALIKKCKESGSVVELYTTLEPCLMCLGVSVHHRLNRIIYACPDPNSGATHLKPLTIKKRYADLWPKIQSGLMKEDSFKIMLAFFEGGKTEKWKKKNAKLFKSMQKSW